MYKTTIVYLILLFSLFTQSYADVGTYVEKTEAELYEEAVELFDQKKYKQAIRAFQAIEDLYPLSDWAMKAKLLSGVASYNLGDYGSAASSIDDYIYIYSNGENLPYAYYLRVLSYYMQINKVQLGQQTAYKTLELATEYINLFSASEYIDEIKEKAKLVTEHISEKEYAIGKFYLKRGEYLAAIKRLQNIESYKNSSYLPRSINYLVKAYSALGLDSEAKQYESMLAENSKPTA
ncbi:outer membrane protein assembly factor BamD [Wolbachia endosymbiont of Folsomia candida]|uniref:outer membrane protein assembly factor BamD n=1 Tax=Wolbachia endosymbiont of Folsomia candida TaxID=169402 RepID=UPI000A82E969|nr:outer membrane protein assembly factor BamD [Wolbachia endosymbiont of Folsomia candida]APR98417.1 outer membrane protein assembly factor BamD [Wolbachia endosymbiont of Folsomia candida]